MYHETGAKRRSAGGRHVVSKPTFGDSSETSANGVLGWVFIVADLVLRNHSGDCIHGNEASHNIFAEEPGSREVIGWCPGGREVTIDYEAAVEFAKALGLCADDEVDDEPEPFADQVRWVIEVAVFGETEAKGGRWLDTALEVTDE